MMKTTYQNCFRSLGLLLFAVAMLLVLLASSSCRRWSHHGDIDGHWQITQIELLDADGQVVETQKPHDLYIAINLELLQLYENNEVCTARMYVHGDVLDVDFSGIKDVGGRPNPKALRIKCGFLEEHDNYTVETANCERLVLRGSGSVISARRW